MLRRLGPRSFVRMIGRKLKGLFFAGRHVWRWSVTLMCLHSRHFHSPTRSIASVGAARASS